MCEGGGGRWSCMCTLESRNTVDALAAFGLSLLLPDLDSVQPVAFFSP